MSTIFRTAVFSALTVVLMACINIADPDQVKNMPTDQLCETYYFEGHKPVDSTASWSGKQADIKKELEKRQAVAPAEWALIDQGHIEMNMGECALKAAWGYPLQTMHTSTATGDLIHYTYTTSRYADVTDGKVTGFRY